MEISKSKDWSGLCQPCKKTGFCATGKVFCRTCKQIFCEDCVKLHKFLHFEASHNLESLPLNSNKTTTVKVNDVDISPFLIDPEGNVRENKKLVKYKYIEALSCDHDHAKCSYPNEVFCVRHRQIICDYCWGDKHQACKRFLSIEQASKILIESGHYVQVVSRLKSCHKVASEALDQTLDEKKTLKSKELQLLRTIQELKVSLIEHACRLEQELVEQIDVCHGPAYKNLTKTERIAKKIRQSSKEMLDLLKNETKHGVGKSSFKSIMECHLKSTLFDDILKRISDVYVLDDINECSLDTEYTRESIKRCIGSLGTIKNDKFNSRLPLILSTRTISNVTVETDKDMTAVFGCGEKNDEDYLRLIMDQLTGTDKKARFSDPRVLKYGVVSIIVLNKDELLALDRTTCSILLLDRFGDLVSSFEFKCMPWSMTLYDDAVAAVSIPGENKIYLVGLQFREFVVQREINCDVEPSGLAGYEDSLYITSYPWSPKAAVNKIDKEGKVVASLETDASGKRYFKAPLDICVDKLSEDIFVCDSGRKILFAFNDGLVEKFRIDLEYMGHPSSMTLDAQGNVFICGKLSDVIYKVITAKKKGKIIFTEEHGLARPQAIAFMHEENSLCVLCARENMFKILPTSKQ